MDPLRDPPFLVRSSPRRSENDYFTSMARCGLHTRDERTAKPLPHVGAMPSLAEVQRDPTILTGLPLPVIVDLRRQITHLAADVDAVLYRTLTEVRTKDQRSDIEPDRLLTPEAAAARFGVTKRWLLDRGMGACRLRAEALEILMPDKFGGFDGFGEQASGRPRRRALPARPVRRGHRARRGRRADR